MCTHREVIRVQSHISLNMKLYLFLLAVVIADQVSCGPSFNSTSNVDDIFNSNSSSVVNVDANKTYPALEAAPVRKYGEEPTNRVLPFDLKEEDYEDDDGDLAELDLDSEAKANTHSSDYCARLLRSDLLRVLKKLRPRVSRQSQSESGDSEGDTLLQSYLDFDISQVVSPLLNIMGSAMTRNATAIDEHYKQLPPLVKTEVTDILSVFVELLRIV